jgi:hypothetical protein
MDSPVLCSAAKLSGFTDKNFGWICFGEEQQIECKCSEPNKEEVAVSRRIYKSVSGKSGEWRCFYIWVEIELTKRQLAG